MKETTQGSLHGTDFASYLPKHTAHIWNCRPIN